jgi:hypothetical protein
VKKIVPVPQVPDEDNNLAGMGCQPVNCAPITFTGAAKSSVDSDRCTVIGYIREWYLIFTRALSDSTVIRVDPNRFW